MCFPPQILALLVALSPQLCLFSWMRGTVNRICFFLFSLCYLPAQICICLGEEHWAQVPGLPSILPGTTASQPRPAAPNSWFPCFMTHFWQKGSSNLTFEKAATRASLTFAGKLYEDIPTSCCSVILISVNSIFLKIRNLHGALI